MSTQESERAVSLPRKDTRDESILFFLLCRLPPPRECTLLYDLSNEHTDIGREESKLLERLFSVDDEQIDMLQPENASRFLLRIREPFIIHPSINLAGVRCRLKGILYTNGEGTETCFKIPE